MTPSDLVPKDKALIDGLWARFESGAHLTATEEQRLVAAVEKDETFLDTVVADRRIGGQLRILRRLESHRDDFPRRVAEALKVEPASSQSFARGVSARLAAELGSTGRGGSTWRRGILIATLSAGLAAIALWITTDDRSAVRTPSVLTQIAPQPRPVPIGAETQTPLARVLTGPLPAQFERLASVAAFDFDKPGALSHADWRFGEPAPCPPGGSRGCLRGQRHYPRYPDAIGVFLRATEAHPLTFTDDLYLSFDYWLGDVTSGQPQLWIMVGRKADVDGPTERPFQLFVDAGVGAQWHRIHIPLSLLRTTSGTPRTLIQNDALSFVQVLFHFTRNDILYVDRFELSRLGNRL